MDERNCYEDVTITVPNPAGKIQEGTNHSKWIVLLVIGIIIAGGVVGAKVK